MSPNATSLEAKSFVGMRPKSVVTSVNTPLSFVPLFKKTEFWFWFAVIKSTNPSRFMSTAANASVYSVTSGRRGASVSSAKSPVPSFTYTRFRKLEEPVISLLAVIMSRSPSLSISENAISELASIMPGRLNCEFSVNTPPAPFIRSASLASLRARIISKSPSPSASPKSMASTSPYTSGNIESGASVNAPLPLFKRSLRDRPPPE